MMKKGYMVTEEQTNANTTKSTKIRNREFGNWSNSFWDAVEKCDEENKILVMMERK